MKKVHYSLLAVAAIIFLFTACNNNNSQEGDDLENVDTVSVSDDGGIESVIIDGTYKGKLPCADCEGVETTIAFNQDHTYILDAKYIGKDAEPFQYKGSYTVSGQTITLDGIAEGPSKYHIDGDDIVQLDLEGQKIESEGNLSYKLEKQ